MLTQPKTYWPPGCWRCQPVETTHSFAGYREFLKQEPAGNREELLLQPHNGLESDGFIRPEDVK
jgi:hypothetical protein